MPPEATAAAKLTKSDFKKYLVGGLSMAGIFASMTATNKDDLAIKLLLDNVNDPAKFDAICEILGITDAPA